MKHSTGDHFTRRAGVLFPRGLFLAIALVAVCASCGGGSGASTTGATTLVPAAALNAASTVRTTASVATATSPVMAQHRRGFLGAFFRPEGSPPFGVFSNWGADVVPSPYPSPPAAGASLFGASGYCTKVAKNGVSIMTGFPVSATKLSNIVKLGVKFTRTGPAEFFDDYTHIDGGYVFADFDSAQCSLIQAGITPAMNLAAGPVEYNATPGTFSPQSQPIYKTAADFGTWCRAVAVHETTTFPTVKLWSLPTNEVNDNNAGIFPGGEPQIAQYSEACYAAIKAVEPDSFVYGFGLDMDPSSDPVQFVAQMVALGCKVGTCYDGIAIHLSLSYPLPSAGVPCFPLASIDCVKAIQGAAGSQVHVIIGESGYYVPNSVPNEAAKATAVVAEMSTYSDYSSIDGAVYGNVDECALYDGTYFQGGCLISETGATLPAYTALASLAAQYF